MHVLSVVLIALAALAMIGLLYEFAGDHRRAELRSRLERERKRLGTLPTPRPRQGK